MEKQVNDLPESQMIAETESYAVWRARESEGFVYHLEFGGITLHLLPDEWEELIVLIMSANESA